jgi:hypothetical protein
MFWGKHGGSDDDKVASFSIEYVDYVVARTMLAVFEDWLKSVEKLVLRKRPAWIEEFDDTIGVGFAVFGFSAAMLLMFGLISIWWFPKNPSSLQIVGLCFASLCASLIAGAASYLAANSFTFRMWPHGYFPYLLLNKGDQANLDAFNASRSKYIGRWRTACIAIMGGVISSLIAGAITSYIGILQP